MKSIRLFSIFAVVLTLLASCNKNDKETPTCSVSLSMTGVDDTSVKFIITPKNAEKVAYMLITENDAEPSASQIMQNGKEADASIAQEYTEQDLRPSTMYRIVAAASCSGTFSKVEILPFKTNEAEAIVPAVALRNVEAKSNSVTFELVPEKAVEVAYMVINSSETDPAAEKILTDGVKADAAASNSYVVTDLEQSTQYKIFAAAKSEDGTYSQVVSESFTTLESVPVKMGDFYYSDGTWSSGDEEPVAGKECIGIVIMAGRSTVADGKDDCVYKCKDGVTPMNEINGYVVALNDANDNGTVNVAWGSWDVDGDKGAETSYNKEDFLGYYNTQQIIASAKAKSDGLSSDPVNNYPAAYMAVEVYEKAVPAPAASTGWFLPSAQQLHYLYKNHATIHKSMDKLGDKATYVYRRDAIYWSSTEERKENGCRYWANMVNLDEANITPGYISSQQKTKEYMVRSILVF